MDSRERPSRADIPRSGIKDIARIAGVHESTVSRALSPDPSRPVAQATAERIRAVALEVGYRPNYFAAGLRRGRSHSIGLLIPDITDAYNGYVVRGIQDEAERRGYSVLIMEDRYDLEKRPQTIAFMVSRQPDALIVMTARSGDEQLFSELAQQFPVVICLQAIPESGLASVTTDDYLGGQLAAGYLAQLGHRTVAQFVCDPVIECFRLRRLGFEDRAAELGLEVVPFPNVAPTPSFKDGRDQAIQLLASPTTRPTGVFVHTDLMAIGAIGGFAEMGVRCPEDISVISFDASVLGQYFTPSLASLGVPAYDIGERTARAALDAIDTGEMPESVVFAPVLVPGRSAAPVG